MAGVFLALAILGIGLFPPGNVYAAANQAPDADPVVVVLDPGHGGHDQGARYKWGGKTYKEKQLNLAIAKACKTELEKYAGVKVYMTRSSDRFVTLGNRVNFAKSRKADLFVAIHNNASLKKTDHGACVYYPNSGYKEEVGSEGKMAAASIQKQLVALGLKNNGILYRNSAVGSRYPDKSKADYYAVIKRSKYAGFPGLIVEHAYVSNHDDSTTFLNGNDRLKRLGVADATGIAEYFDLILDQASVLQTPVVNADESVTLAWNTVQGADYYRIYRRIAGTKTYVCLEETEETGYTDTGVMPGTSYELLARMARQVSPSQMADQSSVRRFPSVVPPSQLWQGTTCPPGVTAMLLRQAPQLGIRCRPRLRRVSSGSQPGLVKSISMPSSSAVPTA